MTQADTGPNTKAAGTKPGEHRPGLKAGYVFDEDANAALDGLRRVADRRPDLQIIPSHCAASIAAFAGRATDARH